MLIFITVNSIKKKSKIKISFKRTARQFWGVDEEIHSHFFLLTIKLEFPPKIKLLYVLKKLGVYYTDVERELRTIIEPLRLTYKTILK